MGEKVTGYTLLAIGILAILLPAYSVFNIFQGNSLPFNFATIQSIEIDYAQLAGSGEGLTGEQKIMFEKQKESLPKQEILNGGEASKLVNLGAHIFIMGFFASIGARIAAIGVSLIKEQKILVSSQPKSVIPQA